MKYLSVGLVSLAAIASITLWETSHADFNSIPYQDPMAVSAGQTIYGTNCVACHGAKLEGQDNW
jgi:mono/diheme cytochrome c family protein